MIGVLILALVQLGASFDCPGEGRYLDVENCNMYYRCYAGRVFHMPCPDGLWFNEREQVCDWPENVPECPDSPTPVPTPEPTTPEPTTPEPTTPEPTTPKPTTPEPTTPEPTTPEPTTPEPTTPEPTTPEPKPTTPVEPTRCEPTTQAYDFECPGEGRYLDKHNCNMYYRCYRGRKWHMPCPDGLWFNERKQECDWPENVPECPDSPPTPEPTTPEPTTPKPTTPKPTTPEPTTPEPTTPEPTTPEPTTPKPTTPEPTTPEPTTPEPTTPEPTTPEPTTPEPKPTTPVEPTRCEPTTQAYDFECPGEGRYLDKHNCNMYYRCYRGRKWHMPCPDGLWFNERKQECDWPENVPECPDSPPTPEPTTPEPTTPKPTTPKPTTPEPTTPEPTTPEPTTAKPTTPEPKPTTPVEPTSLEPTTQGYDFECPGEGRYLDKHNCNMYYRCYRGRKWHMPCPDGLWFNERKQECDWPENVPECPDSPPTRKPTTPEPTPTSARPTTTPITSPTTPKPTPAPCEDKWDYCQGMPSLCLEEDIATIYCRKSCGHCGDDIVTDIP